MTTFTILQPDDWHCHLRDGTALQRTVPDTVRCFARAIIMPNLVPPVTTAKQAIEYKKRIMDHVGDKNDFTPLMTLFLNDSIDETVLRQFNADNGLTACKYYPAGATTHSNAGVAGIKNLEAQLEVMQACNIPLLVHGESVKQGVDIFDREQHFIDEELGWVVNQFPKLRVVVEHVSSEYAVKFVLSAGERVAATVTPQHLLLNRNDLLMGGLKPDYYCLPILKTARDQQAICDAVLSGHQRFFLGTDSAPHSKHSKYSACGCAGCYSACSAIELYTEFFDQNHALDKLEAFASRNGARFYQLPENTNSITLTKTAWQIPEELPYGDDVIVPLFAGKTLQWQLQQ